MNLLQIQKISKSFGGRTLINEASLSVNVDEHIGVIGPNGAGKTTLFKMIAGLESYDSGEVIKQKGLRIGYLEQESDWNLTEAAEEFLERSCIKPIWDLKQIGLTLGLSERHFAEPLTNLSGGYRMRMKLLYLIGLEPDLMLLDEPTNFLDLESILALENFLQQYKGSFLLISHDREFLKRTTEATVEVEGGDISKFPGHIEDYFEQKAQLAEILQARATNLELKRKHMQDFVDRFSAKATKARQAQSRVKQLEKLEKVEIKDLPVKSKIKIPPVVQTGKEVLTLTNCDLGYGDKTILSGVDLIINRGMKIGIVGYNGAGKSTLLKSLAGRIPLLSGDKKEGVHVKISYFAQHSSEDLLNEDTILESLQKKANHDIPAQEILNMAGSLLFGGGDIHKKIKVLSGGEKSRVALGQILLQRNPVLIMDEPTNHLDFDTVEALGFALDHFNGTLVVVSHDRSFLKRVSKQILEIRDGNVFIYQGTYDDYLWSVEKGSLKEQIAQVARNANAVKNKSGGGSSSTEKPKFNFKEESKRLQGEIKDLQRNIAKCEKVIADAQKKRDTLNAELLTVQGAKAGQLAKDLSAVGTEIDQQEEQLLNHMESLDQKEKELATFKQNS
ncbi:MAG: ATP-binding cassette domain-containing protein [Bdellovibrio sp.]|nr:ATP-binding cassette domain-containing protein [Bdellovibrio sp.]